MNYFHHPNLFLLCVGIPCGGVTEAKDLAGVSHLIEHLLFADDGTREIVTQMGGVWNAMTSPDTTLYYIVAPIESWEAAMNIVHRQITEPLTLTPARLDKARHIVIEEMLYRREATTSCCPELFHLMKSGTPYDQVNVIGTRETLASLTVPQIKHYKEDMYKSYKVVVGAPESHKLRVARKIKTMFDSYEEVPPSIPYFVRRSPPGYVIRPTKKGESNQMSVGFTGFSRSDERANVADLIAFILKQALHEQVREKLGGTYRVRVFHESYFALGVFVVHIESSTVSVPRLWAILQSEIKALAGLRHEKLHGWVVAFERFLARLRATNPVEMMLDETWDALALRPTWDATRVMAEFHWVTEALFDPIGMGCFCKTNKNEVKDFRNTTADYVAGVKIRSK